MLCCDVGQQNSSSSASLEKQMAVGWGGGREGSESFTGQGVERGKRRPGKEGDKHTENSLRLLGGDQRYPENSLLLLPCRMVGWRVDDSVWSWQWYFPEGYNTELPTFVLSCPPQPGHSSLSAVSPFVEATSSKAHSVGLSVAALLVFTAEL